MAKSFSFEDAAAPEPTTFSFEDAVAPTNTFSFEDAFAKEEAKVTGIKEKTKKGESVLEGTKLVPGAEPTPTSTFKLPGFEHLYPSDWIADNILFA